MFAKRKWGVLSFVLISSSAQAGFEVVKGDEPVNKSVAVDLSGFEMVADRRVQPLMQVGVANPVIAATSAGFSDGIPLETALKVVLPPGWSGYMRPAINKNATVRWTNGSTWLGALEQVGRQLSISAVVDWNRKVVTLEPMPVEAVPSARGGGLLVPHAVDAAGMPVSEGNYGPSKGQRPISPTADGNTQINYALPPELGQDIGLGNPNIDPLNPAMMQTKYRDYATMEDFLNEEIQVDLRGASLRGALERILPPGWDIDIVDRSPASENARIDVTHISSRGAILNGVMKSLNLTLFPYVELRKAVVSRPPNAGN